MTVSQNFDVTCPEEEEFVEILNSQNSVGFQDKAIPNGIQDNNVVNGVQNNAVLNGVQDNSVANGVQDNSVPTGVQDNVTDDIQDNNVTNGVQDNSVTTDIQVNSMTDIESNMLEENGKESLTIEDIEQQQKSKEQLKSLISRGKLLSFENKRKLKQEKVLRQRNKKQTKRVSALTYASKKRPIYCADCKITFTSERRFNTHKARNNGKCVFACEFCDKVFLYRKSRYDLHILSAHSKERPFTCNVCHKGYVTSDKLKIHKRVHTGKHLYI